MGIAVVVSALESAFLLASVAVNHASLFISSSESSENTSSLLRSLAAADAAKADAWVDGRKARARVAVAELEW